MKLLNVMSILVLSFGITAHADQEVVNDLPSVVRTCQEAHDGAPVLDGAKTLTISRDQFGATYLTVIQKDQFAGYSILIENRLLTRVTCMGIVPCERYEADGVAIQLFLNYFSDTTPISGNLESPTTGSVEIICGR